MEQTATNKIHLGSMLLVGITARTSNTKEMTGNGKIAALWQRFWEEGILSQIPDPLEPSEIVVAYTEFETDENGEYTILIGTKVSSEGSLPNHLTAICVAESDYLHVPSEWGPISEIGINTWKKIWSEEKYRKNRSYKTDLEIYGINAKDPNYSQFDIYLGIRK